jgi:ribonuclease D
LIHMSEAIDTASDSKDFTYVDTEAGLVELLEQVGGSSCERCAIDIEADSLHCYEEKLCLIQFAAADRFAVIDPLAFENLQPFVEFLDSTEVWLHGADFDMRMLRRTFNRIPGIVYDTQTAARLLGARKFGLANLVDDHFGVVLPKGSQKADWGRRPLSRKMLDYAVNDVRYLLPMAELLVERLHDSGRWEWFTQSCSSARAIAEVRREKDKDMVWRISGWGKLERKGMAYLRALWFWRDGEAARRDRPPFKIIGTDRLLEFAGDLQFGKQVSLPERFPASPVRRFMEAIGGVTDLPEEQFPERIKRIKGKRDSDTDQRFDRLKAQRDKVAEGLDIDATLIGSKSTLEKISAQPEKADELLLNWQKQQLQAVLADQ